MPSSVSSTSTRSIGMSPSSAALSDADPRLDEFLGIVNCFRTAPWRCGPHPKSGSRSPARRSHSLASPRSRSDLASIAAKLLRAGPCAAASSPTLAPYLLPQCFATAFGKHPDLNLDLLETQPHHSCRPDPRRARRIADAASRLMRRRLKRCMSWLIAFCRLAVRGE